MGMDRELFLTNGRKHEHDSVQKVIYLSTAAMLGLSVRIKLNAYNRDNELLPGCYAVYWKDRKPDDETEKEFWRLLIARLNMYFGQMDVNSKKDGFDRLNYYHPLSAKNPSCNIQKRHRAQRIIEQCVWIYVWMPVLRAGNTGKRVIKYTEYWTRSVNGIPSID